MGAFEAAAVARSAELLVVGSRLWRCGGFDVASSVCVCQQQTNQSEAAPAAHLLPAALPSSGFTGPPNDPAAASAVRTAPDRTKPSVLNRVSSEGLTTRTALMLAVLASPFAAVSGSKKRPFGGGGEMWLSGGKSEECASSWLHTRQNGSRPASAAVAHLRWDGCFGQLNQGWCLPQQRVPPAASTTLGRLRPSPHCTRPGSHFDRWPRQLRRPAHASTHILRCSHMQLQQGWCGRGG